MLQRISRPTAPRTTAAVLFAALALACAPRATVQSAASPVADAAPAAHDMSSMAGGHAGHTMTGLDAPVTIPPGALFVEADVRFMQGMIAHHAQAIYMSRLAEAHRANPRLQRFAIKIDQSQTTEIHQMQGWLRANGQFVPDTSSYHTVMMPGMLTPEQIAQLDGANGPDFDRAFLVLMIQHHEGALMMVKDLFATPRAGQDVDVSVFANDVVAVQTAEIGLMRQMISSIPQGRP
ncbi:MAG: DUF305 domain-containing protein [Gemmatimonadetes bacterium]|nr:DUF305 domain-containing protein [Gemmatimonadota bacterium]